MIYKFQDQPQQLEKVETTLKKQLKLHEQALQRPIFIQKLQTGLLNEIVQADGQKKHSYIFCVSKIHQQLIDNDKTLMDLIKFNIGKIDSVEDIHQFNHMRWLYCYLEENYNNLQIIKRYDPEDELNPESKNIDPRTYICEKCRERRQIQQYQFDVPVEQWSLLSGSALSTYQNILLDQNIQKIQKYNIAHNTQLPIPNKELFIILQKEDVQLMQQQSNQQGPAFIFVEQYLFDKKFRNQVQKQCEQDQKDVLEIIKEAIEFVVDVYHICCLEYVFGTNYIYTIQELTPSAVDMMFIQQLIPYGSNMIEEIETFQNFIKFFSKQGSRQQMYIFEQVKKLTYMQRDFTSLFDGDMFVQIYELIMNRKKIIKNTQHVNDMFNGRGTVSGEQYIEATKESIMESFGDFYNKEEEDWYTEIVYITNAQNRNLERIFGKNYQQQIQSEHANDQLVKFVILPVNVEQQLQLQQLKYINKLSQLQSENQYTQSYKDYNCQGFVWYSVSKDLEVVDVKIKQPKQQEEYENKKRILVYMNINKKEQFSQFLRQRQLNQIQSFIQLGMAEKIQQFDSKTTNIQKYMTEQQIDNFKYQKAVHEFNKKYPQIEKPMEKDDPKYNIMILDRQKTRDLYHQLVLIYDIDIKDNDWEIDEFGAEDFNQDPDQNYVQKLDDQLIFYEKNQQESKVPLPPTQFPGSIYDPSFLVQMFLQEDLLEIENMIENRWPGENLYKIALQQVYNQNTTRHDMYELPDIIQKVKYDKKTDYGQMNQEKK